MALYQNADSADSPHTEFWDRLRRAADVPCLVSGVFCGERRLLQDVVISAAPDCGPKTVQEMIRLLSSRLSVFTTGHPGVQKESGVERGKLGTAGFPVWLRIDSVAVVVGRPGQMPLYPVVACGGQHGPPDAGLRDLLGLGLAHVVQALARQAESRPAWPDGLAEATLRLLSIGFFVVDARGGIVHDHSGGDRTKDPVWITSRSRLSVASGAERLALQAAITDATSEKRAGSIISVSCETGRMQMAAVAPFQQGDQALALVLFEVRQTDHGALREHFFRVHALTRSEGLIAREVLDGRAPAEIAQLTGMSVGTVRSYLKQVFAKTGTHRQSELVSHYYSSILPIGVSIARADLRSETGPRRSPDLMPTQNHRAS